MLSASEWARADRFRHERHRRRFIMRRAAYRRILSRFVGVRPEEIRYAENVYGKPALAPPFDKLGVSFNASHSQETALFAVSAGGRIGVDIEHKFPIAPEAGLLRRVLTKKEREKFARLPEGDKPQEFCQIWARKEAIVKAEGQGLCFDVLDLEVGLAPFGKSEVSGKMLSTTWRLHDLDVQGFGACVTHDMPRAELYFAQFVS